MSRISELFERDPLKLTRHPGGEVDEIVAEMRKSRALFNTEGAPKATKAKAPKDTKAADDILKEVGLI